MVWRQVQLRLACRHQLVNTDEVSKVSWVMPRGRSRDTRVLPLSYTDFVLILHGQTQNVFKKDAKL